MTIAGHLFADTPHGPTCSCGRRRSDADKLARAWADSRGVPVDPCAVDHAIGSPWPGAGPRRNERMLRTKRPTHGVAFPGERGTADMVRRMKAAGLPVWEVS